MEITCRQPNNPQQLEGPYLRHFVVCGFFFGFFFLVGNMCRLLSQEIFSLAGFLFIPMTDYMLKPEWSDSAAQLRSLLDLFCLKHEGLNSKQRS